LKEQEFRDWLADQGFEASTQSTQINDARRIETHYGDLDVAYGGDNLEAIRTTLTYSKADEAAGRENPAKFPISGNLYSNLAGYRTTLKYYLDFRKAFDADDPGGDTVDKRITLFDDQNVAHWPVRQKNAKTGVVAFRIKGSSNRTDDAIEVDDIIAVARALFEKNQSVRVVRSNDGRRPYLGYGAQKLTSYSTSPDIAKALGLPESGTVKNGPPTPTPTLNQLRSETGSAPLMVTPTNLILYGPPGTGKTYATAREAVKLCKGAAPLGREELMIEYNRLTASGRIEFVTFHQSYSYEEFVEGLRPNQGDETSDEVPNKVVSGFHLSPEMGVFRRIARRAETSTGSGSSDFKIGDRRVFKMSVGAAADPEDAYLFEEALDKGYTLLGYGNIDWTDARFESRDAIIDAWRKHGVEGELNAMSGRVQCPYIFRNWMKKDDLVIVSKGNSLFRAIGIVTGNYEFVPRESGDYCHRRAVRWLWHDRSGVPVDEIYARGFSMRSIYLLTHSDLNIPALERYIASQQPNVGNAPEPFVLIIDEINRANISKVFGELITLLEADKRLNALNELKVRLPYSRDMFGVPANLHVIGTMNTADRSIALLDTALRRRFEFRELMPDPTLLADASAASGINLIGLLSTVNQRIEYLFDREHQIGHAYFIGCRSRPDVDAVMRYKVIPLLAEYFYEDWSKVAAIIGDAKGEGNFLERTVLQPPSGFDVDDGVEPRYRWSIKSPFNNNCYLQFQ
jgi:5-methylcytosine-specific restriction protein B